MTELFKKKIAPLLPELILFAGVFLLLCLQVGNLISIDELPGWDTSSHYLTLQKMATEFLPQGQIAGPMPEWLGGIPLFDLYAPLYFVLTAGFWIATFQIVPLTLVFRASIFLILFGFVVSLWYLVKTFFGKEAARWAIPLSLLFLFYPKLSSTTGIGIGGTVWVGLISSLMGLNILMLWISLAERLRLRPSSKKIFFLTTLAGFCLILTHTLSFIAGLISIGIFGLFHFRNKKFIWRLVLSLFLSLSLSSFWLVSFIKNLPLASGAIGTVAENFGDPLLILFPFNPVFLLSLSTLPYFKFWALALFVLAGFGLFLSIQQKKYSLPIIFGVWFVFVVRNYLSTLFPNIDLHYNRFAPWLLVLAIAMASLAIATLWQNWAVTKRKKIIFLTLAVVLVGQSAFQFTLGTNAFASPHKDLFSARGEMSWRWSDFAYTKEAENIIKIIGERTDVNRVSAEMPFGDGLIFLGSPHFFTSQIPLRTGKSVITGLYVESSPLTPFILPTLDALTGKMQALWGDTRLSSVEQFYRQSPLSHLGRLQHLGVNYIITYTPSRNEDAPEITIPSPLRTFLEQYGAQLIVATSTHFTIFELPSSRSLISSSPYKPGIYLNADGKIPFRDIATTLYAGEKTYDLPFVDWPEKTLDENAHKLENFSTIIVSGATLSEEAMRKLESFKKPLIILNSNTSAKKRKGASSTYFIDEFEVIPKGVPSHYRFGPSSWAQLIDAVNKNRMGMVRPTSSVVLYASSSKEIEFSGTGPVLIRSSFSSRWKVRDCPRCYIYQVSPAEMLIFSDGKTALVYDIRLSQIGIIISGLGLLILASYPFYQKKRQ